MLYLSGLLVLAVVAVVAFFLSRKARGGDFHTPRWIPVSVLLLIIPWTIGNGVTSVATGHVGVPTVFNEVVHGTQLSEGLSLVNPLYGVTDMSLQRQSTEFHSGGLRTEASDKRTVSDVTVTSRDDLPLTADVTFPFFLNAKYASVIYQKVGTEYATQLVRQVAASAMRKASRRFLSHEAMADQDGAFTLAIQTEFAKNLAAELMKLGLEEKEAGEVFRLSPVLVGKVLPPERVLVAIAEKEAALQDKQRQETLTDIAAIEAQRRENEGLGVANLMARLPKEYSPSEIALILGALATKEKADAITKAVATGRVSTIIMDGGTSAALPLIQSNQRAAPVPPAGQTASLPK